MVLCPPPPFTVSSNKKKEEGWKTLGFFEPVVKTAKIPQQRLENCLGCISFRASLCVFLSRVPWSRRWSKSGLVFISFYFFGYLVSLLFSQSGGIYQKRRMTKPWTHSVYTTTTDRINPVTHIFYFFPPVPGMVYTVPTKVASTRLSNQFHSNSLTISCTCRLGAWVTISSGSEDGQFPERPGTTRDNWCQKVVHCGANWLASLCRHTMAVC